MADELQAWFDKLPGRLQQELAGKVERIAQTLSDAQRARFESLQTPPEESGAGAASFRVEPGRNGTVFYAVAGGPTTTRGGYDHMVGFEFGTQHQPARPYFYSTYHLMAPELREQLESALDDAIEKA